jgi:transcriptional regulator with PAS, ATPase and Fis domain
VGRSPATRRALELAAQVAATTSTVLLLGETGTGKERFAAYIHQASPRRDRHMVRVNCSAIPSALMESELFGREKGAYTGALTRQIGRFELAHGSTIFLDEIGDLPMDLQGKLLRILQEGEYCPVGDTRPRQADVRFIAATHQDLERASFRKDLYYRLRFAHIAIPPLRQRRDDILLLATRFVEASARPEATLSDEAQEALVAHDWPGNVRELKGTIEAAANLAERGEILARHLHLPTRRRPTIEGAPVDPGSLPPLAEVERRHILRVYEATGRNKTQTAKILGIAAQTLHRKLDAYRVD